MSKQSYSNDETLVNEFVIDSTPEMLVNLKIYENSNPNEVNFKLQDVVDEKESVEKTNSRLIESSSEKNNNASQK